jgi:hypothetical protein
MSTQNALLEQTEYRLLLVLPDTHKVLSRRDGRGYLLPCVHIPKWARPAGELQKAIKAAWTLSVIILDLTPDPEDASQCVVAEVISSHHPEDMAAVSLERLPDSEISARYRTIVQDILAGECGERGCFSRIGWIAEAVAWLRRETGKSVSLADEIQQYNASGAFALLRFPMQDGSACWMKATGAPNTHEFAVTVALSELCPHYLPSLIAVRHDWNAWLMQDAGQSLESPSDQLALEQAVVSMAELQKKTVGLTKQLMAVGVLDQCVTVLREHSLELVDYLEEAMAQQTSTKVPKLEHQRLSEIGHILQDACFRMENLGVPDTVVHGDLNRGNILFDGSHCRFIDWSEAYIGNPFIGFQHLSLLMTETQNILRLKDAYRCSWLDLLDSAQIDSAFALAPLLAAASYLYGRGDWLRSPRRSDPHRQRYSRSLARHMDRAAQAPELLGVLCH